MSIAVLKPWTWLHRAPRAIWVESRLLARRIVRARHILWAVTRVDFEKRYAGSVLGLLWYPLYSALLLGMYSFVYMVILQARYADFGNYEYVLFIFAGLVPYLGFSDAVASSASSVKANIALVRNAVFPVELIPIKQLLVSMAGLLITLVILLALIAPTTLLGWHVLYLPVSLALLLVFTGGVVWLVSALAALVPDVTYVVNLLLLFFLFVSPIGYSVSQVPEAALLWIGLNPMTHLIESFRFSLLGIRETPLWFDAAFGVLSLAFAATAGTVFRRLTPIFADYE
jgi:lipopolysaccharide transport system permease protein